MRYISYAALMFLIFSLVAFAQPAPRPAPPPKAARAQRPEVIKTPDQHAQDPETRLLKQQRDEARKLSQRLIELSTEIDADVEKTENVLPLGALKKLDEIEKITKKLRSLLKQ